MVDEVAEQEHSNIKKGLNQKGLLIYINQMYIIKNIIHE